MGYVGPRGIPLSEFLGWSPEDQDAVLAWQGRESSRCNRCGRPHGEPVHAHVDICPGCVAYDTAAKTDLAKQPGAHVSLAPGHRSDCERCRAEDEANAATGPARPRRRRRTSRAPADP